MSPAPLVAIVTPVYNGAKYLAETMDAVQAQTYPNLVHVLLDNASVDETPAIIARYAGARVPVIAHRNPEAVTIYPNWNRALSFMPAETALFRILCADDLITPDAIEKTAALMARDPAIVMVLAAEQRGPKVWRQGWGKGDVFNGREKAAAYFRDELAIPVVHCLFRKAAYDARAPEFFDQSLNNADMDTALSIMRAGMVGYVHEPVLLTREHAQSMTVTTNDITRMHYPDWLVYLQRYGADVMGKAEADNLARRFKRFYFRRMLLWGVSGKAALRARHADQLAKFGAAPRFSDYLDAALDWPLVKFGLRPAWEKYPY